MGFSRAIIKVCIFLLVEAGEFVCGVCLFSLFGLSVRSFQSLSWLGFLLALGIFPGHFSGASAGVVFFYYGREGKSRIIRSYFIDLVLKSTSISTIDEAEPHTGFASANATLTRFCLTMT